MEIRGGSLARGAAEGRASRFVGGRYLERDGRISGLQSRDRCGPPAGEARGPEGAAQDRLKKCGTTSSRPQGRGGLILPSPWPKPLSRNSPLTFSPNGFVRVECFPAGV